jgi:hypothetical protein
MEATNAIPARRPLAGWPPALTSKKNITPFPANF